MIIWLASYPKSGNTLLRAMLSAYLFSKDGVFDFELLPNIKQFPNHTILDDLNINADDKNEIIKNSIRCQEYFDNKNSVGFVKTHTMLFNYKKKYPFTNLDHTLGVIYLVRDPRNVVLSYARHLDISIEEAVKFMTTGKVIVNDIQGNWSENYQSWKAFRENDKYLLIKYEELILKPEEVFLKILKFIFKLRNINFSIDRNKLDNVINSTTFDNLKNLEKNNDFKESMKEKKSGKKINFFDKGGKRDWSKSLDKNLVNKIEDLFKHEMVELGYL
tara:strand:- start:329 stop:1150 length:822 start_codon:yes stop_codon:yes gene_type:complete